MSKVSAANIAANRANAKRSTGPRTPEGKARSSQNARKHIFNPTSFPVVRLEEIDEVDRLRADAIAAYQPVNSQETFAVERIVLAQQALLRAERLHSGIFTICLNETVTDDGRPITAINPILVNDDFQICRAQNRNFLLAEARSAWRPNAFEERLERPGKSATPDPDRSPDASAFLVPDPVEPPQTVLPECPLGARNGKVGERRVARDDSGRSDRHVSPRELRFAGRARCLRTTPHCYAFGPKADRFEEAQRLTKQFLSRG
jgi:hypothetical protein